MIARGRHGRPKARGVSSGEEEEVRWQFDGSLRGWSFPLDDDKDEDEDEESSAEIFNTSTSPLL